MRTDSVLVLAALAALSGCALSGCSPSDSSAEAKGVATGAIVNGTPSTADQDAVVFIIDEQADSTCTGTLIAPNLVLTARHCVSDEPEGDDDDDGSGGGDDDDSQGGGGCGTITGTHDPGSFAIGLGVDASQGDNSATHGVKVFTPTDQDVFCGNDVALIQLQDELDSPLGKINFAAPKVSDIVMAVGYGEDGSEAHDLTPGRYQRPGMKILALGGTAGSSFDFQRQSGSETVDVPPGTIITSEGACHGDSGGPLFNASGEVVGTVSGPALQEDACVDGADMYTGLSQHEAFIRKVLEEVGHPLGASSSSGSSSGGKPAPKRPTLPTRPAGT